MDDARIREMLEQHHGPAFGWALHCIGGDREEAAELLQAVYVKILEGKARFEGRSTFKTWLFSIVRRASWKRRSLLIRSWERFRSLTGLEETAAPDLYDQVRGRELRDRLRGLLARLSPRQQEVLHLVFYQEMTVEEASAVMGVSVGSARTHYQRGKGRLLDEMQRSGIADEYLKGRLEDPTTL